MDAAGAPDERLDGALLRLDRKRCGEPGHLPGSPHLFRVFRSRYSVLSGKSPFARQNGIKNAKRIIEEVSLAISHFYDYATNHQIDDYWKDRIEEHLSGLVSPIIGKTMKHYLPTIVEPYETENGFLVSEINIIENTRHDFRIEAVINGKRQKYIAGRKSDLAVEIIAKGRNKMTVENKKELVERLLLPLAKR